MHAATLVDQFGEELEADFHECFSLDLCDWFRGRHPWGKLVRLADQLPRHSRYVAALYEDEEVARRILENESKAQDSPMTLQGWTREIELFTVIAERLDRLTSTLIAVNSQNGRGPDMPALPRPRTMVDRLRSRSYREEAETIANIFRPREI